MALDVETVYDSIITILKANTTTIMGSVTSSDELHFVRKGDARNVPQAITDYPGIMVQLLSEKEAFAQLGQRLNDHELTWSIIPLVYNTENETESDKDARTMTKNIKSVLKSNITLSGTAHWSMPSEVDYFAADLNGVFCSASIITFQSKHLST